MNPEETQDETLRMIAVDMLTRIDDGTRMTSDGIARYMMDLVVNYGYRSYDDVAKRVLQCFYENPNCYAGDHPFRYTNLTLFWQERFPDSYKEHQQLLKKKDAEDKSVVDLLMDDLSRGFVGFEPTEGNE